jgi:antitoxin MazE
MKVELIRVGNSRGIRIPKPIIEQCGFEDAVELRIENDHLVIAPARLPREGWEEAFRAAGLLKASEAQNIYETKWDRRVQRKPPKGLPYLVHA